MPWTEVLGSDADEGQNEALLRRLAWYIASRAETHREQILKNARISDRSLRRYASFRRDPSAKRGSQGPQKLSEFFSVCLAIGDDPARVILAAQYSTSPDAFERLLRCGLLAEDTLQLVPSGGKQPTSHTRLIRIAESAVPVGEYVDPEYARPAPSPAGAGVPREPLLGAARGAVV